MGETMKLLYILLLLALLIQGCAEKAVDETTGTEIVEDTDSTLHGRTPRQEAEDHAREAAFRYWFADIAKPANMNAYYLSLGAIQNDIDPSEEFMKRFEEHQPPVKKVSQCEYEQSSVREKKTGKIGLLYWAA
jgi:hypothetical protein